MKLDSYMNKLGLNFEVSGLRHWLGRDEERETKKAQASRLKNDKGTDSLTQNYKHTESTDSFPPFTPTLCLSRGDGGSNWRMRLKVGSLRGT